MEIKGQIHAIGTAQTISDNFSKLEIVLKTDAETAYPNYLKMELSNTKMDLIKSFNVGDNVTASINIKGRLDKNDSNKAYPVSLDIWKLSKQ